MAHRRILFVGGIKELEQIFADCPDSSSEPAAMQAFDADYIDIDSPRATPEFTKANRELYDQVLDPEAWSYCYDIRDTKTYGDFGWMNIKEQMEEDDGRWNPELEKRNQMRIIDAIRSLPDDTVFFFADSHY